MGGMLARLMTLAAYVCVASLITEVAGAVYLRVSGKLDDARIDRILAAAQGLDSKEPKPEQTTDEKPRDAEQPSYEDREQARELQARQLEMREQALKSGLDRIRFEQSKVAREKEIYDALQSAFDTQLDALRTRSVSSGRENVRMIWENIKPKQAKEQILQMLENQELNEVVAIFSAMPISKRAKIVSEFKTPEETEKLGEILRLIRSGVPEVNLIDKTRSQINKP
jgi:hypothetical protein